MYSAEVTLRETACGFDDAGKPKNAIHKIELRNYSHFAKGILIGRYPETNDEFLRCS